MAAMDDEVADIGNPGEGVGGHKDPIGVVAPGMPEHRVEQQQQRTGQAQPPECRWHHHLPFLLGRIPLDKKAGEENEIAEPANDFPP